MKHGFWITLERWRALAWSVLGHPLRALECWDRLIETWGPQPDWMASRAHLRAQLGQHDSALQDCQWLCSQPQAKASDWFNHGFLLEQAGRTDEAAHCFEQAIARDGQLDRAWYGLGLCRIRQGRLDEAIEALRRNTQLQPMSPHGWVELARVHEQRQEPEQVLKIIEHLRGFEPKVAAELMRESGIRPTAGRT